MFNLMSVLLLILIVAIARCECDVNATKITVVDENSRFQFIYPNAILQKFGKTISPKGIFTYTFGSRIDGDQRICDTQDLETYPTARDVQVFIHYPAIFEGKTITQIEVIVDQSSTKGDCFLVNNDSKQQVAQILIEGNSTKTFSYFTNFYGY